MIENELREAIQRDELVLHFQPQVVLSSQKVSGVEALVRWNHPDRGQILPSLFIPIAEESGLVIDLGKWVIQQAFRQVRIWQKQGIENLRIAINISALQFQQSGFPNLVKTLLVENEVEPKLVEFELTESALMHNMDNVLKTLEDLKSLGLQLAVDDFGTGYSSLNYLRRFPIDRLKIDQSFVKNIHKMPVNRSIARTIIALANSLTLKTIAEGIEASHEKSELKRMGCEEGQGYLFAKPMPADEFSLWLASYRYIRGL